MSRRRAHIAMVGIPAVSHVLPSLEVIREPVARGHRVTYANHPGGGPPDRRHRRRTGALRLRRCRSPTTTGPTTPSRPWTSSSTTPSRPSRSRARWRSPLPASTSTCTTSAATPRVPWPRRRAAPSCNCPRRWWRGEGATSRRSPQNCGCRVPTPTVEVRTVAHRLRSGHHRRGRLLRPPRPGPGPDHPGDAAARRPGRHRRRDLRRPLLRRPRRRGRLDPSRRCRERPADLPGFGVHPPAEFYRNCLAAFGDQPGWHVVLQIGRHTDPREPGVIPANVEVHSWVPQRAILEQADAFVTHAALVAAAKDCWPGCR